MERPLTLCNLEAIFAVSYRVRSPRGVQFRRWTSMVLKEYLVKGFVMDDERLNYMAVNFMAKMERNISL